MVSEMKLKRLSELWVVMINLYVWHFLPGYSQEMWDDWGKWFKLAIPGLIMLGLQWWVFEAGTICSGRFLKLHCEVESLDLQISPVFQRFSIVAKRYLVLTAEV